MNREKILERLQKEIKRSSEFPHIAYGIKTIYDFIRSVDDDTLLAIINEEVNTLISNGYNPKENNIIKQFNDIIESIEDKHSIPIYTIMFFNQPLNKLSGFENITVHYPSAEIAAENLLELTEKLLEKEKTIELSINKQFVFKGNLDQYLSTDQIETLLEVS